MSVMAPSAFWRAGGRLKLKRGYKPLIAEANAKIETLSVADALTKLGDPDVVFVDIRETRNLSARAAFPAPSTHAPHGACWSLGRSR
jgi:hypothetical protein